MASTRKVIIYFLGLEVASTLKVILYFRGWIEGILPPFSNFPFLEVVSYCTLKYVVNTTLGCIRNIQCYSRVKRSLVRAPSREESSIGAKIYRIK